MKDWRALHLESLQQNRPDLYRQLQASGSLVAHLNEIADQADSMYANLLTQQRSHPQESPGSFLANLSHHQSAEEIVMREIVLVPDLETERAERDGYEGPMMVDGPNVREPYGKERESQASPFLHPRSPRSHRRTFGQPEDSRDPTSSLEGQD